MKFYFLGLSETYAKKIIKFRAKTSFWSDFDRKKLWVYVSDDSEKNLVKKCWVKKLKKKNYAREALPPKSPSLWCLNPPNQLVIGYHWLAFLNHECKKNVCPRYLE